jgi:hypothetical protein
LTADAPYLSFVATSRNDDHGGDMTRRMQIFVRALAAQAARHRLPCELVLVEWNPPGDRPPLADALEWSDDEGFCPVRVVTVSNAIHRRFAHADRLPLFQMIAKNAGIRRAAGEFVLATNVDIVFSDPLMEYLAGRRLSRGVQYRSDRVDADRDVPLQAPIDAVLEYCRSNVLRVNRADGTYTVPADAAHHRVEDAVIELARPRVTALKRWLASTAVGSRLTSSPAWDLVAVPVRSAWVGARNAREVTRRVRDGHVSAVELMDEVFAPVRRVPSLHTNGCGDFTLMSRDDWFAIDGYPELEMFSFHLDGLGMYVAHARGIREERLPGDMVHYHIEHGAGWTPQSDAAMYERVRARRVPILTAASAAGWADRLRRDPSLRFNGPSWGLAEDALPERRIERGRHARTD